MNDNSKNVVPSNIDLFNVNSLTDSQEKRDSLSFFNQESIWKSYCKLMYTEIECSFINVFVSVSNLFSRNCHFRELNES